MPSPPPARSTSLSHWYFFINNIPGISIYRKSAFSHHSHPAIRKFQLCPVCRTPRYHLELRCWLKSLIGCLPSGWQAYFTPFHSAVCSFILSCPLHPHRPLSNYYDTRTPQMSSLCLLAYSENLWWNKVRYNQYILNILLQFYLQWFLVLQLRKKKKD